MKSFLILAAAALVYAQADSTGYFPGEPSCALPCLSAAITEAGCQLSDIACQCGPTKAVIAGQVAGCLLTSCTNPTDLGQAANAGEAVCSSFFAGELSFTSPDSTAMTPTPVPGSSSAATGTSVIMTNPPTPTPTPSGSGSGSSSAPTSSGFMNITSGATSSGITHTDTLINPSTLTGSLTGEPSSTPTGAGATQGRLAAGVLAGIAGAIAFL
ncbi:putative cell wall protein [Rosellinia necatrix]|uniref:Putative cell wall protein n=1 Tax=Rosellinia necatrix TaxID=77044 RepID=A0A1W2TGA0_ROSNE|nr:putative cell wall protein [Rosellinia necatrix]